MALQSARQLVVTLIRSSHCANHFSPAFQNPTLALTRWGCGAPYSSSSSNGPSERMAVIENTASEAGSASSSARGHDAAPGEASSRTAALRNAPADEAMHRMQAEGQEGTTGAAEAASSQQPGGPAPGSRAMAAANAAVAAAASTSAAVSRVRLKTYEQITYISRLLNQVGVQSFGCTHLYCNACMQRTFLCSSCNTLCVFHVGTPNGGVGV